MLLFPPVPSDWHAQISEPPPPTSQEAGSEQALGQGVKFTRSLAEAAKLTTLRTRPSILELRDRPLGSNRIMFLGTHKAWPHPLDTP